MSTIDQLRENHLNSYLSQSWSEDERETPVQKCAYCDNTEGLTEREYFCGIRNRKEHACPACAAEEQELPFPEVGLPKHTETLDELAHKVASLKMNREVMKRRVA